MPTKQRSRSRRNNSRDREPRFIAPVLDPGWQSPYVPSTAERHANQHAVRKFALRRKLPQTILISVLSLALVAGVVAVVWLPVLGVALALQNLAKSHDRLVIFDSASSSDLTGKNCSPNLIHWTFDTWELANSTARSIVGTGAAVTTWNYDPYQGFLTNKAYADGNGPVYTYTPAGRLLSRTWPIHWSRPSAGAEAR